MRNTLGGARGKSVSEQSWVVLTEHLLRIGWTSLDQTTFELLALESELLDAGIPAAFDPFRPGESGGFTETVQQPIRLLVRSEDLDRAREVMAAHLDDIRRQAEADSLGV